MIVSKSAAAVKQALTKLRDYQQDIKNRVEAAWAQNHQNVLAVLPTGGGKTVVISHIVLDFDGTAVVMAHRRELIGQISVALAQNGIPHRIVAPDPVIKAIIRRHIDKVGTSYYDPNAKTGVASVDTVNARMKKASAADQAWCNSIGLWVQDEAHHVLRANKWGKAVEHFPNALGLGVTATPERADGKGLGRHASGVFDILIEGVTMRWLINEGYLVDYRIVCSQTHIDLSAEDITASGDYSQKKSSKAIKNSQVIGDIVQNYLKWTPGKRGVTFLPDVESASDTALKFRNAGVPAEALSGTTDGQVRERGVKRLETGELKQLVNVDLFGEGFDLPAIDVAQFAQPTVSFSRYAQQFGRVLRPVYAKGYNLSTREGRLTAIANSDKPFAWIIDHVGNVIANGGPPDKPRAWTLDDREKRGGKGPSDVPYTNCLNELCFAPYERFYKACPFCGTPRPLPERRDGPEFVDGDLCLMDPDVLARLRGEEIDTELSAHDIRRDVIDSRVPAVGQEREVSSRLKAQQSQRQLRELMEQWSGWQKANGITDMRERERKFYHTFGVDVSSARALKVDEATKLMTIINQHMGVETV